jgi:hypothetical protein
MGGQHIFIFSLRWHGRILVNSCSDRFCVLAVMKGVWLTHVEIHFVFTLARVITSCDTFCLLAGMAGKYFDIFLSLLAWEEFVQHMLRYILCFLAGIGGVGSRKIKVHILSPLPWEGFGQHMFRCIFCPR